MENKAKTAVSVAETKLEALQLTEEAIHNILSNIQMAEKLVMEVLEKDIDYGVHPGTDSMALRDPGASKIINSFNCYPDHKILHAQENEDIITFQIQANLINRVTGKIVGTGIGAASTMESKYGFRWVEKPEDYGYNREDLTRRRKGKYRIPNPEIGDLSNTILKMAAKRSETDACQSLPGVGSALRKLFQPETQRSEKPEYEGPLWQRFWGEVKRLGLTEQEARLKLGVTSMKDWIASGHPLDEAINIFRAKQAKEELAEVATRPAEAEGEDFKIDLIWLSEAEKKLKWTDETLLSFITGQYKVAGKTVTEALNKLTREQAEKFVREIEARVAKQPDLWG